jgi:hypothetical protein
MRTLDKINDPVASGEARAGRVVGAAGGCGNMNSTRTLQVRHHKQKKYSYYFYNFLSF